MSNIKQHTSRMFTGDDELAFRPIHLTNNNQEHSHLLDIPSDDGSNNIGARTWTQSLFDSMNASTSGTGTRHIETVCQHVVHDSRLDAGSRRCRNSANSSGYCRFHSRFHST